MQEDLLKVIIIINSIKNCSIIIKITATHRKTMASQLMLFATLAYAVTIQNSNGVTSTSVTCDEAW